MDDALTVALACGVVVEAASLSVVLEFSEVVEMAAVFSVNIIMSLTMVWVALFLRLGLRN